MAQLEELFEKYKKYAEALTQAENAKAEEQQAEVIYNQELEKLESQIKDLRDNISTLRYNYKEELKTIYEKIKNYIKYILKFEESNYIYEASTWLMGGRYFIAENEGKSLPFDFILEQLGEISALKNFAKILEQPEKEQYKVFKIHLINNLKKLKQNYDIYIKQDSRSEEISNILLKLPEESKFKRKFHKKIYEEKDKLTAELKQLNKDTTNLQPEAHYYESHRADFEAMLKYDDGTTLHPFVEAEALKIKKLIEASDEYESVTTTLDEKKEKINSKIRHLDTIQRKEINSKYKAAEDKSTELFSVAEKAKTKYEKLFNLLINDPSTLALISNIDETALSEEEKQILESLKALIYENLAQKLNG